MSSKNYDLFHHGSSLDLEEVDHDFGFLVQEGDVARKNGDFETAVECYERAVDINDSDSNAWFSLAYCYGELEQYQEAIEATKMSIRLAPRDTGSWNNLGHYYRANDKFEEAISSFTKALSYDPFYRRAIRNLISCYQDKKDLENEIYYRERLVQSPEANPEDWDLLGIAYWNNNQFDKAAEAFSECARRDPKHTVATFNAGLSYDRMNRPLQAARCFRTALLLNPDYEKVSKQLERIERLLRDDADYIRTYEADRETRPLTDRDYINPYELLDAGEIPEEGLPAKKIQRMKKHLLQEIELEDGRVAWMQDALFDASRVHQIINELDDPRKATHHLRVYQNTKLLDFLSRSRLFYFCYDPEEADFSFDEEFKEFISPYFATSFDEVFFEAFEKKDTKLLEILKRADLPVTPDFDDRRFQKVHRYLERFSSELSELTEKYENGDPNVSQVSEHITRILRPELLNLLPSYFNDVQTEIVRSIRTMAIDAFNVHGNAKESVSILREARKFKNVSPTLKDRLEKDSTTIGMKRLFENLSEKFKESEERKYSFSEIEQVYDTEVEPVLNDLDEEDAGEVHNRCAQLFRSVAIDVYNHHGDSDLSLKILQFVMDHFNLTSPDVDKQLGEDFEKIEEIIKQEHENDVALTFGGKTDFSVDKHGMRYGEEYFSADTIDGLRWGITAQGNYGVADRYDFFFEARDKSSETIRLFWSSSPSSEERQTDFFNKIVEACLIYFVPRLVERRVKELKAGREFEIGNCHLTRKGISFQTHGFLFRKDRFVQWSELKFHHEGGHVHLESTTDYKAKISLNQQKVWNAVLLPFIALSITENKIM